ncbi:MAG TPA: cyclic lactone autoinducer peptide [Bacillota bacterium]|nr:cyclic lactone autoinducer peptide [Clostridiaceae bacterium]HNR04806.1 cyclic lactone autoinducer peptide [Bacillota bacterium]HNT02178.1 cyclic lactone autoinducer peptide [Bacillota bacterium]HPA54049.1 cyclic lactone autoinducer peptide [Bacillota bacterium]HQO42245.1 cyclic lactone autoinducer peptide [Bacillota bacterium]
MKRFLKPLMILISTLALLIASTSTTACYMWSLREPKMPESLIKRD